jgi:hypothetical protein
MARTSPPLFHGQAGINNSGWYGAMNLGKYNIALDLKNDAGRDNAFHAGSLDVVKAVVATPVRYRRASGLHQMRLPNQPNCICCAARRSRVPCRRRRRPNALRSLKYRFILRIWIADAEIKLAYEHVGHVVHVSTDKHRVVKCAVPLAVQQSVERWAFRKSALLQSDIAA